MNTPPSKPRSPSFAPSFAQDPNASYSYGGGASGGFGGGLGGGMNSAAAPSTTQAPMAGQEPAFDPVIDVTEADFQANVLEASLQVPVLLDCWAPWCGPCKALGPVLEKLAREYAGRFVLAKINTDEAPNLSAALRIRSIPLVVLFVGGRPVDQFIGAKTEGEIRKFLDRHLAAAGAASASPVEMLREEAKAATEPQEAESILMEALELEPTHLGAKHDLAELVIARGALDEATAFLETVPEAERNDRHSALLKRIELARNRPAGDAKALAARIAANSKDHEARFALAAIQVFEGDYKAAFDQLLEVVMRDKAEQREKARQQLIEWFAACPDAEAVSQGRRYLGMYLN